MVRVHRVTFPALSGESISGVAQWPCLAQDGTGWLGQPVLVYSDDYLGKNICKSVVIDCRGICELIFSVQQVFY